MRRIGGPSFQGTSDSVANDVEGSFVHLDIIYEACEVLVSRLE